MGLRPFFMALVCASVVMAAQVQNLSEDRLVLIVDQPTGEPWKVNESACVFRNRKRIACGFITDLGTVRTLLI